MKSIRRSVIPAISMIAGMIVFTAMYNRSVHVTRPFLNDVLVWTGLIGMIASVFLSPLFIYGYTFSKGAGFAERCWASLAAPIVKSLFVWSRFFGLYSAGEVFLLLIHHCVLGPVVFGITEIGIASLVCHGIRWRKTGDPSIKIFLRGESILLLIGAALFVLFLWNFGHFYYYTFLDLYIRLFPGGAS